MREFSYSHVADTLRRHRLVLPASIAACLMLSLLWLNIVTPCYTAAMVLGPTARTGIAARGIRLPLENLQNERVRANSAETSEDETLSDFSRAIQLLTSSEVATLLLQDNALPVREKFLQESSPLKSLLWRLAGQRLQPAQDAQALAAILEDRLRIDSIGRSAMRRISFRHADRQFAVQLLDALYRVSDLYLRRQAKTRTAAETAYLRTALESITQSDERRALTDLLAEQEQTRLLIEVDLPFAADQIQKAQAPVNPDWPPVGLVLFFALCLGCFIGCSTLYLLAVRDWLRQRDLAVIHAAAP